MPADYHVYAEFSGESAYPLGVCIREAQEWMKTLDFQLSCTYQRMRPAFRCL